MTQPDRKRDVLRIAILVFIMVAPSIGTTRGAPSTLVVGQVAMERCRPPNTDRDLLCGQIVVPENWSTKRGRKLALRAIIVPAKAAKPALEPLFLFFGGPGQSATDFAGQVASSWFTDFQNVVLVDERGTSGDNRLDCASEGSDGDLEGYLRPPFRASIARRCRDILERRADLSQYSTEASTEDFEAARKAFGYGKILIAGGSGGTYSELLYLRTYGAHVRAALLNGIVLPESKVPLYHAAAAQEAFDELALECARNTGCHAAYPDVQGDLQILLEQLESYPAAVTVKHPSNGDPVVVHLSRPAFADAVRVMMYSGGRDPFLLGSPAGRRIRCNFWSLA
jgi:pimeloyl-ACP methyl ester carboxylesterase